MRIGYFINTFKSSNWGGQATSNGIKYLLNKEYPDSEFVPLDLPDLPYKKVKLLRKVIEFYLIESIMSDDIVKVRKLLEKLNIKEDIFDSFSHICFNGEGAVHYRSGHLIRFMGMLYLAKHKGKMVASVNQTIDLNGDKRLEQLVSKVYNMCDFVSFREPISYNLAKEIGIEKSQLIPDAVYGLKKLTEHEINSLLKKYNLPKNYIAITGSSKLKRNMKSVIAMKKVLRSIKASYPEKSLIFLSNAKTDYFLAKRLQKIFNIRIITNSEASYDEAMAIIAKSDFLIGGRQHPNIFAYIYKTPYVAFEGNTFKNYGVAQLQNYPIKPLSYSSKMEEIIYTLESLKDININFKDIQIDEFRIF